MNTAYTLRGRSPVGYRLPRRECVHEKRGNLNEATPQASVCGPISLSSHRLGLIRRRMAADCAQCDTGSCPLPQQSGTRPIARADVRPRGLMTHQAVWQRLRWMLSVYSQVRGSPALCRQPPDHGCEHSTCSLSRRAITQRHFTASSERPQRHRSTYGHKTS